MRKPSLGQPSPALVIALLALFVALGGTTYAAVALPKNSVGTAQLKKGAVTGSKIANATVVAANIDPAGLTVPQAADAQLFAGKPLGYFLPATSAAVNSLELAGYSPDHFLSAAGTAADSSHLEGHPAGYFLPMTATAANSLQFDGYSVGYFLPATGTAANASELGGNAATYFLPATGTAANASELGGEGIGYFLPATGTAANASELGGHAATYYLSTTGTAADASLLAGKPLSYFLSTTETAANSSLLGSHPASYFLSATGTAADASLLGGEPLSYFVSATGTAADSSLLGSHPASYFLSATGTAADAYRLGGYPAATYYRLRTGPLANTTTTVDSSGNVGGFISATVGSDGLPVISYYDSTNRNLDVAHCGTADCSSGNTITVVDNNASAGQSSSIEVGADGLPLISYVSTAGLEVAHCGNVACTSGNTLTTVDSSPGVGQYTSVIIGADGLPFISYWDNPNRDLKAVHCGDVACTSGNTITTVDSSSNSGTHTSSAAGADGLPVISYGNASSGALKVLHCGNLTCTSGNTITTVDSSSCCNNGNSTTIGADGLPLISYVEGSTDTMIVLHCGSLDCASGDTDTTVAVGTNDAGSGTATVGPDGLPLIAYYTQARTLKFLHCGNLLCSSGDVVTTLASDSNNIGGGASLTIGADGLPLVTYYDAFDGFLKTVHCSDSFCVPFFARR